MSQSLGSLNFTDTDYQAAAATYLAGGSAPSWWGSQIAALNTAYNSGSGINSAGSAPPPPSFQTIRGQQAIATASAADKAWIAGLAANRQGSAASSSIGTQWVQARNSLGLIIYVNKATGQISRENPKTNPPPQSSIPTLGDVSQYLQSLLSPGSSPAPESAIQQAYEAAGSAEAAWIAGLSAYRLGSDSLGSYGVGSVAQKGPSTNPAPGSIATGSGRSVTYFDGDNSINTPTNQDVARGIARSDDINAITYDASIRDEPKAAGPIVTLLDLTNRDQQENDIFPIRSELTWFTRDQNRRVLPFTPVVQETALRGPAAFGQRFTFDLGSILIGDLLLGTVLQIRLDHWLDPQTQNVYAAGLLNYANRPDAWEYANSLGTSILQLAELEVDGKTLETIDGDFIQTFSALFPDYNAQFGIAYDHLGQVPIKRLTDMTRSPTLFPVENGNLNCILPFFFARTRLREALPMIAIREGYVKIHITLRPFDQCVRQMRGIRDTCTSVPPPLPTPFTFSSCTWKYDTDVHNGIWDIPPPFSFSYTAPGPAGTRYSWNYSADTSRGSWYTRPPTFKLTIGSLFQWTASTLSWSPGPPNFNIAYQVPNTNIFYYWDGVPQAWRASTNSTGIPSFNLTYGNNVWNSQVGDWSVAAPPFKSVQLLTYGAIVDGSYRSKMLHDPFEILHRQVQTFSFDEPLKYSIGKRQDAIRIQLPLEANHPIEEILWFVRRKGVGLNNEWTNFTGTLESEWSPEGAQKPMLQNAIIQVNGTVLCDADEQFYREGIASAHRGGYAAYSRFIYGYSFAKTPGEHQPSGSLNASRINALRLVLDVNPPGGVLDANWEVKVFCIGLNWLRFENGLANPMFED